MPLPRTCRLSLCATSSSLLMSSESAPLRRAAPASSSERTPTCARHGRAGRGAWRRQAPSRGSGGRKGLRRGSTLRRCLMLARGVGVASTSPPRRGTCREWPRCTGRSGQRASVRGKASPGAGCAHAQGPLLLLPAHLLLPVGVPSPPRPFTTGYRERGRKCTRCDATRHDMTRPARPACPAGPSRLAAQAKWPKAKGEWPGLRVGCACVRARARTWKGAR